ncbi:porin family protein [Massilibacteroides vaginae]|uniref:porin family protein n=1 Tax=Massilibacteroides vaginae TaxID=1673718 RepID=UPI000A1CB002|nr:porin family protein [Massilibacteroides vaginae]
MKKLILLFFTLCALQVSAQKFHFAPRIGMNIANVTNSDSDSRIGLNIGFAGEMVLTPKFSLESGLYYSMQGAKEDNIKLNIDYINLPILAKVYAYEGLNFFAGPQLSFKTSAKGKTGAVTVDMPSGLIKGFDTGLQIGAGYQFDMGLQLSASYTYGLIGVMDLDKAKNITGGYVGDDENGNNSVFRINFGWRF